MQNIFTILDVKSKRFEVEVIIEDNHKTCLWVDSNFYPQKGYNYKKNLLNKKTKYKSKTDDAIKIQSKIGIIMLADCKECRKCSMKNCRQSYQQFMQE